MNVTIYKIVHAFYAFIAAMAVGCVFNLVIFFGFTFLFAGADGDRWIRTYMGSDGVYFVSVTILLACAFYPITRKLNIVSRMK